MDLAQGARMAAMQHQVARSSGRCHATGRELKPGEVYFSALVDTVTGPERRDYAKEAWQGPPPETIGFWQARMPTPDGSAKPAPLSVDAMLELFDELTETGSPEDARLIYVLALLLIRRRALKLHSIEDEGGKSFLVVGRPKASETNRVIDPGISESEFPAVEAELAQRLSPTS